MYSLYLDCTETECELLSAELWEEGASGIQEETVDAAHRRLRAWFEDPSGLLQRFSPYQPRLEAEPEVDWELASRQAWQPFEVGRRFYLAPEWDESRTPAGRLRLTIHPGLALGTGAHPATQLCLEALETHLRPGDSVLDVGTGSGILLSAVSLLGAGHTAGCDIELESVSVAHCNLLADSLPPHVFAGSTRAVRPQCVDLLVANINAITHEALAAEYARISRRDLILSGFPDRHSPRVAAALAARGFQPKASLTSQEWACLILTKA